MNTDNVNCVLAIISIAILSIVAMNKGIDGQLTALSIAAIAGLGGYEVYKRQKNNEVE
jgi:hypothetical protein